MFMVRVPYVSIGVPVLRWYGATLRTLTFLMFVGAFSINIDPLLLCFITLKGPSRGMANSVVYQASLE